MVHDVVQKLARAVEAGEAMVRTGSKVLSLADFVLFHHVGLAEEKTVRELRFRRQLPPQLLLLINPAALVVRQQAHLRSSFELNKVLENGADDELEEEEHGDRDEEDKVVAGEEEEGRRRRRWWWGGGGKVCGGERRERWRSYV